MELEFLLYNRLPLSYIPCSGVVRESAEKLSFQWTDGKEITLEKPFKKGLVSMYLHMKPNQDAKGRQSAVVEIHHCSMTKDKKIQMDIEWGNQGKTGENKGNSDKFWIKQGKPRENQGKIWINFCGFG